MGEIKNNPQMAEEIAKKTETETGECCLTVASTNACEDVWAEECFTESWQKGIRDTEQMKIHVSNAYGYIRQISATLEEADQTAASRVLKGISFGSQMKGGTGTASSLLENLPGKEKWR